MKNYAKYCKINLYDKKYQLNLTENGQDDAHFFNKFLSVNFWLSPVYMLYKLAENIYLSNAGLTLDNDLIPKITAAGIIFLSFCLPITNTGKGYNAILRSLLLKNKTKKFYERIRELETYKNKRNCNKLSNKQVKIANSFVKKLKSITNFNEFLSRKYQKRIQKKGFVDGTRAFANDNIESVQEAVDKFIFHNRNWLYEFCPKYQGFIKNRAGIHYNVIRNNGSYYDEYIWSIKNNEMLVKNDCLDKSEKTHYFDKLKTLFDFEKPENKISTLKTEERKIDKVKEIKSYKDIYKSLENELN